MGAAVGAACGCILREDEDASMDLVASAVFDERFLSSNRGNEVLGEAYATGAIIGSGAFASVRRARSRKTGQACALKVVRQADSFTARVRNEIAINSSLDHPHIARLFDVYEDRAHVYMVFEMCNGEDLVNALTARRELLGEPDILHLAGQLLWAVNYLHSKCIAHRDLKLDNLLLKEGVEDFSQAQLKLVDFGLSKRFEPGTTSMRTRLGSALYVAPEVVAGPDRSGAPTRYTEKCDVWSCGVVLFMFVANRAPFDGADDQAILRRVLSERVCFHSNEWRRVSEDMRLLVTWMLRRTVQARASASEAMTMAQGLLSRVRGGVSPTPRTCRSIRGSDPGTSRGVSDEALFRSIRAFNAKGRFERHARRLMARRVDDSSDLQEAFRRMDTKGIGAISREEMKASLTAAGFSDAWRVDDLFHQSGDGDQTIGYSEFLAVVLDGVEARREELCWEAFRLMDKDRDGRISAEDLLEAMTRPGVRLSTFEAEAMLRDADGDGDGAVSFPEFLQMMVGPSAAEVGAFVEETPRAAAAC